MCSSEDIDNVIRSIISDIDRGCHDDLTTYAELAPIYDYVFARSYNYELQAEYVKKVTPRSPTFRVLEAGCGTGRLLDILADEYPDANLHGVDLHGQMLQLADERLRDANNLTLTHADVFDIKDTEEYEIVLAFNLLPHFDDETLVEFFQHAAALLTDNGTLVVDYKDPRNNPNGLYDIWEEETDDFRIVVRFLTVYENDQPYYAVSHEFVEKSTDEQYWTGELMEIQFQRPEVLEGGLWTAGFESVTVDRGVGDQSGVIIARK